MISSNKKILQEVFRTSILKNLDSLERWRKEELMGLLRVEALFMLGIVIISCISYAVRDTYFNLFVFLLFIILMLFCCMVGLPLDADKHFREELKNRFFPIFLKNLYNMKWGINDYNIKTSILQECGLFAEFQREKDDDTFQGYYNEVNFNITETQLFDVKANWLSKRQSEYEMRVFKGVIISFDSPKSFRTTTLITTKNDFDTKNKINFNITILLPVLYLVWFYFFILNTGYNENNYYSFLHPLPFLIIVYFVYFFWRKINKNREWTKKKIKLEDPVWEKKFNVYSDDEVEARYLITTSFMERFLNLNTAFGTRKAKCAFYKDSIIFAISTRKNLFELGSLFTPLTTTQSWVSFINELSSILDMIEYFKLDEKTML